MKKTICISRRFSREEVQAEVFGDWAVHTAVNRNEGKFAITHIPSGLTAWNLIGWAVDDERAAIAVAKKFAKNMPPVPEYLWNQTQKPGSDALDLACLAESLAAEVLAGFTL